MFADRGKDVSPSCMGFQSGTEPERIYGSSIKSGHVHALLYPLFQTGGVGDDCQWGSLWPWPAAQTGKIDEQPLRSPLHWSRQSSRIDLMCHHNAHVCPHTHDTWNVSAHREHRTDWITFSDPIWSKDSGRRQRWPSASKRNRTRIYLTDYCVFLSYFLWWLSLIVVQAQASFKQAHLQSNTAYSGCSYTHCFLFVCR